MSSKYSLEELLNLSLGTPEIGAVNFNYLHEVINEILKHLGISKKPSGCFTQSRSVQAVSLGSPVSGDRARKLSFHDGVDVSQPGESVGGQRPNTGELARRKSSLVPPPPARRRSSLKVSPEETQPNSPSSPIGPRLDSSGTRLDPTGQRLDSSGPQGNLLGPQMDQTGRRVDPAGGDAAGPQMDQTGRNPTGGASSHLTSASSSEPRGNSTEPQAVTYVNVDSSPSTPESRRGIR